MANLQNKQVEPASLGRTDEEWQAAENVITSLQLARKNYSLYPEDHINCTRAMERFWQQLETFLQAHGNLRFELDKDRLIFQEEPMLIESPEDGNLPFTLFRDGIQWLEFQDGIEAKEVEAFLRILNKYRHLSDEPEGDLVLHHFFSDLQNGLAIHEGSLEGHDSKDKKQHGNGVAME